VYTTLILFANPILFEIMDVQHTHTQTHTNTNVGEIFYTYCDKV